MNEKEYTNAIRELEQSDRIGIILPESPSTDAIGAGIGLYLFLEKRGKRPRVIAPKFELPKNHAFLPRADVISSHLGGAEEYLIQLDVSKTQVDTLSYDVEGNKLNIRIKPKSGSFREQDVQHKGSQYSFDTIITLDAANLESLGSIFEEHPSLFYGTPLIVFGHDPENEHFGQINLVDISATSISEIVYELINRWEEKLLDEHIATNLLTGIITKTKIFRSSQVTPRSLAIASLLVEQGARRADIVKHLYQTKTIPMLKLWGRALARLQEDSRGWFVWTVLTKGDFEKTGAKEEDISGVIDELIVNTPKAKVVAIVYESTSGVQGIIASHKQINNTELLAPFDPKGTGGFTHVRFLVKDVREAEKTLRERVTTELQQLFSSGE
ncbi:MAG: DHH family phosphoesterase [Patescibacteria group bacterium]|jgi:nanoRNase/pAp phosphatase (c-di-AMP/oligoRNAs hydrolase)